MISEIDDLLLDGCRGHNIDQVVIDPSLYLGKRSDLMYAVETRTKPNAFNIFGGNFRT